jgi:hypothetical protein
MTNWLNAAITRRSPEGVNSLQSGHWFRSEDRGTSIFTRLCLVARLKLQDRQAARYLKRNYYNLQRFSGLARSSSRPSLTKDSKSLNSPAVSLGSRLSGQS